MERREDMRRYLLPYRMKWLNESAKKMEADITSSINEDLQPILLEMTEEIITMQKQRKAKRIEYLAVFYLRSSIITGSHEYMIMLADDTLYLDDFRLERYWYPAKLYKTLTENISLAQKEIRKQFVRVTDYEMAYISRIIEEDYFDAMEIGITANLSTILKVEQISKMNEKNTFSCIYGEYMGPVKTINSKQM